jgi:hypothetical protein
LIRQSGAIADQAARPCRRHVNPTVVIRYR